MKTAKYKNKSRICEKREATHIDYNILFLLNQSSTSAQPVLADGRDSTGRYLKLGVVMFSCKASVTSVQCAQRYQHQFIISSVYIVLL